MKKYLALFTCIALVMVSVSAFAGMSRSSEWQGKPSLNAETKSSIAAIYNPAGLTKIADGLHLSISDQMAYLTYSNKPNGSSWNDSEPTFSYLVPMAIIAYKKDNSAVFFSYDISAGGATVTYKEKTGLGYLASLNPALAFATEFTGGNGTQAFSLGASHAILNGMLSFTGGVRALYNVLTSNIVIDNNLVPGPETGDNKIDSEQTTYGWQGFFGFNVTPIKDLTIAMTYESAATLTGENVTKCKNMSAAIIAASGLSEGTNKAAASQEQSGRLLMGVGYNPIEPLNIQISYTLGFDQEEKVGDTIIRNTKKDFSHNIGLAADYQIIKLIGVSLGFNYAIDSENKDTFNVANPGLDYLLVGIGTTITPIDNLGINVAFAKPIYFNDKNAAKTEFKKDVWTWGFGLQYKVHGTY